MSFNKINFLNKIILLRVDYNIPFINNEIQDDSRIRNSISTIKKIINKKGKVVLISHLGRPSSNKDDNLSLIKVLSVLQKIMNVDICFLKNSPETYDYNYIKNRPEKLFLLENMRFYKGEVSNDISFAKSLAKLADIYINDAFSVSHRKHASVYSICDFFEEKYFGPLFIKEVKSISDFINTPETPLSFIFGGAKISTKIKTINNVINYADNLIIGGSMAFPFLKIYNYELLGSKYETKYIKEAREIIKKCEQKKVNLCLPLDLIFTDDIDNPKSIYSFLLKEGVSSCNNKKLMAVDIGAATCKYYEKIIEGSKSVIWNGPMGVFENQKFIFGTKKIASSVAKMKKKSKTSLVGGGDTLSAIKKLNLSDEFSYVSTGGGATLYYLSENYLPVFEKINCIL